MERFIAFYDQSETGSAINIQNIRAKDAEEAHQIADDESTENGGGEGILVAVIPAADVLKLINNINWELPNFTT